MLQRRTKLSFTFKTISIFSICIYIIVSTLFESVSVLPPQVSSMSLYLCLILCVANSFLKGKLKYNWIIIAMAFFGIIISLSYFYTPSKAMALMSVYRYWTTLILLFFIYNTIEDTKDVTTLINAFIYAGTILAVFVYFYFGHDYLVTLDERLSNEDVGNMNGLGITCALSVILAIYRMFESKKNYIPYIVMIAICMFIIFVTASRKALLSVVIAFALFLVLNSKKKFSFASIMVAALVIFAVYFIINNVEAFGVIRERFQAFGKENESDANRIMYITEGLNAFKDSFLWGNGFGYSYYLWGTYSHNNYIELLMCHGLFGFCAYYYIYFRIARESRKIKQFRSESAIVYTLLIRLLFLEIGVVNYYSRTTLLLIMVITALIECKQKEKNHAKFID